MKRPNAENLPQAYVTPPESEITTVKSKGRILFPPKPVAKVGSQMTHSVIGEGDIDEATYAKKLMKKLNEQSKVMPMDLSPVNENIRPNRGVSMLAADGKMIRKGEEQQDGEGSPRR